MWCFSGSKLVLVLATDVRFSVLIVLGKSRKTAFLFSQ